MGPRRPTPRQVDVLDQDAQCFTPVRPHEAPEPPGGKRHCPAPRGPQGGEANAVREGRDPASDSSADEAGSSPHRLSSDDGEDGWDDLGGGHGPRTGRKNQPRRAAPKKAVSSDTTSGIQRVSCVHTCPIYQVRIHAVCLLSCLLPSSHVYCQTRLAACVSHNHIPISIVLVFARVCS